MDIKKALELMAQAMGEGVQTLADFAEWLKNKEVQNA